VFESNNVDTKMRPIRNGINSTPRISCL